MYEHRGRPCYRRKDLRQCSVNRVVIAPEMVADQPSGGNHSGHTSLSGWPEPRKSCKTAPVKEHPPARA
jgi:hypothetical protein